MPQPVYFTLDQAQRVADVVRRVEGKPLDLTGKPRKAPRGAGGGRTGSDVRVVRITGKFSTAVGGKYLAEAYPMSPESEDAWTSTSEIIPAEMLGIATVDAIFMNVIEFGIGGSDYLAWDDVTDTDNIYGVGVVVGTIATGTYAGYLIIAGIAFKPNVCSA